MIYNFKILSANEWKTIHEFPLIPAIRWFIHEIWNEKIKEICSELAGNGTIWRDVVRFMYAFTLHLLSCSVSNAVSGGYGFGARGVLIL